MNEDKLGIYQEGYQDGFAVGYEAGMRGIDPATTEGNALRMVEINWLLALSVFFLLGSLALLGLIVFAVQIGEWLG